MGHDSARFGEDKAEWNLRPGEYEVVPGPLLTPNIGGADKPSRADLRGERILVARIIGTLPMP
jgi:hypothetical protein